MTEFLAPVYREVDSRPPVRDRSSHRAEKEGSEAPSSSSASSVDMSVTVNTAASRSIEEIRRQVSDLRSRVRDLTGRMAEKVSASVAARTGREVSPDQMTHYTLLFLIAIVVISTLVALMK